MDMETSEKIQRITAKKGISRGDIIEATGANKSTVSTWFSGISKPSSAYINKLCRLLGCEPDWLLDDLTPYYPELDTAGIKERRADYMVPLSVWDDETPLDDDEVGIPCFTEVEAAAGPGRTVIQENHGPKIRFSRRTLRKCGVMEENAYGIMVSGNSMMPVMPHGATIGVDVGSTKILDGEMYALDHDGMLRVKLLYRVPGNQVRLVSFNREEHADETVSLEDGKLRVIGRVFWYSVLRPAFR